MKNELNKALSPYLLQHSKNPVHWQIWNDKNIEKATNTNKLLIISIGYAACHWCHVMEKECFEDQEVANVMNSNFTSFKIDREELPVVDNYYMLALQLMTNQGGWPLNIVALPNGLPLWGATYLAKKDWMEVLTQLTNLFETNPNKMFEYASKLQNKMNLANNTNEIFPRTNQKASYTHLIDLWQKSFDLEHGGYQRAPKFMMPTNLNFLEQYGNIYKNQSILNHVNNTLTKMAWGGLFDVIEGGFSRYSVDLKWHIPHFEKMLYDNAQLLTTYTNAFLRTNNSFYKQVVSKTLSFILNHWNDKNGGFYASYDADSLNENNILEEGTFYYWKEHHLKQLIPSNDWKLFSELFNINENGYWHEADAYVLYQNQSILELAQKFNTTTENIEAQKENWTQLLFNARKNRKHPALDNKIITSWNTLLLSGFISVSKIIKSNELQEAIKNLSSYLQNTAYQNNQFYRITNQNKGFIKAVLEDYAFTIKAFIELFNSSQNLSHLQFAKDLLYEAIDLYFDKQKGFFKATEGDNFGTMFDTEDNVIPSSNAIMSRNLFYIGILYKNDYFINTAKQMTNRILNKIDFASAYSDWLLNDLIINHDFEYIIIKNLTEEEQKLVHLKSLHRLLISNHLNVPIADMYRSQTKKIQVCNENSCRLYTDNINDLF